MMRTPGSSFMAKLSTSAGRPVMRNWEHSMNRNKLTRTLSAAGIGAAMIGISLMASPAGAATPTTSAARAVQVAACDRAPWAGRVEGAPAGFTGGDKGGDYLWHDKTGFHLRVTHKNDNRQVYSGVISSPTPMRIDPVKLEKGDTAKLSADHRSLVFVFADYGHIDGVNFHTDCASHLNVADLNVGNQHLPAGRVYLGATKANPNQIPFQVHRA